jgi:hypothetical protein
MDALQGFPADLNVLVLKGVRIIAFPNPFRAFHLKAEEKSE